MDMNEHIARLNEAHTQLLHLAARTLSVRDSNLLHDIASDIKKAIEAL